MHDALCDAIRRLAQVVEEARFEPRSTYTLVSWPSIPLPSFNGVWVDEETTAADLSAALGELAGTVPILGVVSRRNTTPSVERLADELDLTLADRTPGMVMTQAEFHPARAAELDVLRLETADGFAQALAVAATAFDLSAEWLAPLYMLEVAALDGVNFYLGRSDGKDVTTAMQMRVGDAVGIFNVGTLEEHRGRGFGAAITSHGVSEGFDSGASFAFLQSSAIGEPIYRRLGFREVEMYTQFVRPQSH
jgi:N-acetylglutamate synthase